MCFVLKYWQAFPKQPQTRTQTKDWIKLPNLHWPWKFWLVQECVSALTSGWNMLSVTPGWKCISFSSADRSVSNCYITWLLLLQSIFKNTLHMVFTNNIPKNNHLRVMLIKSVQSLADQDLPKLLLKDWKIFVIPSSGQNEAELLLNT